jgi:hypothetical protein
MAQKNTLVIAAGYSIQSISSSVVSGTKLSSSDWRLVRGTWQPDQMLDSQTPITFLAIAQQNTGLKKRSLLHTHYEQVPLEVYTIGLIPTGKGEDEYTRVGYVVWKECAWYGYMCGDKERAGKIIKRAEG